MSARLPVLVGDLDVGARLPDSLGASTAARSARLLVRLHGTPIGEVSFPLRDGPVSATSLAQIVCEQVGVELRHHLASDGLSAVHHLPVTGLAPVGDPVCARSRRREVELPTRVTVVIATRDRTASLLECLASLTRSDHPAFDVVVVDSAPRSDSTARALAGNRDWPFALRYVHCSQPGLARAHNAALPWIAGDVVAFTDDDVIVDPHWISALAADFEEPTVDCVTGLILPAEIDTPAQLRIEEAGGFSRGFDRRVLSLAAPPADPLFPFTTGRLGSGANMAFRASWLSRTGGFDPAIGAGTLARGGDDLLAFFRVLQANRTLVYEPSAIVRHRHHRDADRLRQQAFGYGVGLGSYLTAAAWGDRATLHSMARRCVPAVRHLVAHDSAKNVGRPADYPRDLVWRERIGVLTGPFAYARSRRASRVGG